MHESPSTGLAKRSDVIAIGVCLWAVLTLADLALSGTLAAGSSGVGTEAMRLTGRLAASIALVGGLSYLHSTQRVVRYGHAIVLGCLIAAISVPAVAATEWRDGPMLARAFSLGVVVAAIVASSALLHMRSLSRGMAGGSSNGS